MVPVLAYILLRQWIVTNWTWLDPMLTLSAYSLSVVMWLYLSNLRFHFFLNRLLLYLKYDHTTWVLSAQYRLSGEKEDLMDILEEQLRESDCRVEKRERGFVKVLWQNKYLLRFRETQDTHGDEERYLQFDTSAIDVPMRQNAAMVAKLANLLDSMESSIPLVRPGAKRYELDIEYSGRSPYYSYWVRKLPEEMIYNFNCTIRLPDERSGGIQVNKNHVIIKAQQRHQLFKLTQDYVTLKTA